MVEPQRALQRVNATQSNQLDQLDQLVDQLFRQPRPTDECRARHGEECIDAFRKHALGRSIGLNLRDPQTRSERATIELLRLEVSQQLSRKIEPVDFLTYPHLKIERSPIREPRVLVNKEGRVIRLALLLDIQNSDHRSIVVTEKGCALFERGPVFTAIFSGTNPKVFSQIVLYSPPAFEEAVELIGNMGPKLFFCTEQTSSVLADVRSAVEQCNNPQKLDRSAIVDLWVQSRQPGRVELVMEFEHEQFLIDVELVPDLLNVRVFAKPIC